MCFSSPTSCVLPHKTKARGYQEFCVSECFKNFRNRCRRDCAGSSADRSDTNRSGRGHADRAAAVNMRGVRAA